jgi:hypothetical protein
MAETPLTPEPPAAEPSPETAPPSLEEVLAEALDEDDLPQASHPGTPPKPAVLERPAAQGVPSIAATLEVPPTTPGAGPSDGGAPGGGGEWEVLVGKIGDWFGSGELQRQWDRLRGPLRGVAYVLGLVLALRVYSSVVGTLDAIPLIGGLLELVGLIALSRFCLTKLVKTSEREKVIAGWRQRWNDFTGQG